MTDRRLLSTGRAIDALGLSRRTLHRWISNGIAKEGTHFFRGLYQRSPHRWDVEALEQLIAERGSSSER